MKERYSRELIERYRAQDFQREILESVPVDLTNDEAILSCGHKQSTMPSIIRAAFPSGRKIKCQTCAEEWLAKEGDGSEQR